MPRRGMLLLVAGVLAGGCSRDAPVAAPEVDAVEAVALPQATDAARSSEATAEASADAVARLLPALGAHGTALRAPLLRLGANRGDRAARDELTRLLERLDATVPEDRRADLDALRLQVDVTPK